MSFKYIFILIIISFIISVVYLFGYRKNVKLMKEIAKALEKSLKPKDQLYTYLGGVLGFSADYKVDGFKKITANLRLIPRQSALYLPFMFLTSGKDSLQILFWLNKPAKEEFHIIKKSPLNLHKPKIFNRDKLKKETIKFNNNEFEILYENEPYNKKLMKFIESIDLEYFNHLAITTENNIVYVNLISYGFDNKKLEKLVKTFKELSLKLFT